LYELSYIQRVIFVSFIDDLGAIAKSISDLQKEQEKQIFNSSITEELYSNFPISGQTASR